LEEGSWAKEFVDHPSWEWQGWLTKEKMHRDEEIERSVGLQFEEKGGKRWNSIEDRIRRRHQGGHQVFKTARKLAKYDAYVVSEEPSPLIPPPENQPQPIGIVMRRIGWGPGEAPVRGSKDWLWHAKEHWKEEAMLLLKLIPRNANSERTWEWKEKRIAWYCVEFDIPYIRYPWP
jgi:hypothetical protein